MGEMTIRNLDDALLVELKQRAGSSGQQPSDLARDLITLGLRARPDSTRLGSAPLSDVETRRQQALVTELREIRAMTLEPLSYDSTLVIREMRDAD